MSTTSVRRLPVENGVSGWEAISARPFAARTLEGNVTADWLIIGAGFAGLSAARRLLELRPDDRIVILEAGEVDRHLLGGAGRRNGHAGHVDAEREAADRPPAAGAPPLPVSDRPHLHAVWLQKEGAATVVALHGFASDHNAWRSLLAAGRPKARILAIDLPGHGRSARPVPADLDAICEKRSIGVRTSPRMACVVFVRRYRRTEPAHRLRPPGRWPIRPAGA